MRLYGNESCSDCTIARKLLEKYSVEYEWVDVAFILDFKGEIPQLEVDDVMPVDVYGRNVIIGLGNISKYLKGR
jgi:hypothetical protein